MQGGDVVQRILGLVWGRFIILGQMVSSLTAASFIGPLLGFRSPALALTYLCQVAFLATVVALCLHVAAVGRFVFSTTSVAGQVKFGCLGSLL